MVRFAFRAPSLKRRISARTSVKRYVRNSLGLKAPRGWGWLTNPKKAAYNRVYNRTTRGCLVVLVAEIVAVGFVVAALAADSTKQRRASPKRPAMAERQRAAAPTGWDKMVSEAFLDDAFSVLGTRASNEVSGQVPVPPVPHQPKDFDRATLMKSLEKAEQAIARAIASEKTFRQHAALLDEQIEKIIRIASELNEADPDYHDDEDYQRFVQSMRDSAASMRLAGKNPSSEAAGVAFGKIKQSCDSCHRRFR
jgi:cytochrome c556